jgi:hypothetical protein
VQVTGAPAQVPAWQASFWVHVSPSSQDEPVSGAQVPSWGAPSAMLHAWHSPPQAVSQQTPSTQKSEPHSRGTCCL